MKKEPVTLEEVAYNQYTLDISNSTLGEKHKRSITIPQLRKLGFTLTSKEYRQAYTEAGTKKNLASNKKLLAVFAQLKERVLCSVQK